jgi:hypothetical protein
MWHVLVPSLRCLQPNAARPRRHSAAHGTQHVQQASRRLGLAVRAVCAGDALTPALTTALTMVLSIAQEVAARQCCGQ